MQMGLVVFVQQRMENGEDHLLAVAAYILYIEYCLCGLVVGPWENLDYRKHWRRCLEQASTEKEIWALLLGVIFLTVR